MPIGIAYLVIAPRMVRAGEIHPEEGQYLCSAAEGSYVWRQQYGPADVQVTWHPPVVPPAIGLQPCLEGVDWEPAWEEDED